MQSDLADEYRVFLSTDLANRSEVQFALVAVLASAVAFLAVVPFAAISLSPIAAFIPAYEAAVVVSDLITAAFLFIRFNVLRSNALLVLGVGYLFTAVMTFAHTLCYLNLFSQPRVSGVGSSATMWLYMLWHTVLPLFVILYAVLKSRDRIGIGYAGDLPGSSPGFTIMFSVLAVLVGGSALAFVVVANQDSLPVLIADGRFSSTMTGLSTCIWMLGFGALAVLWCRPPHTVLDLWLMAVMCAWLFDLALDTIFNSGAFDLGFYIGRIYGLLAASALLIVLMVENGKHYARLAQMEGRYRGLLEAAPDAMVVVNQDGEIVLLNIRAEQQFGYSRDELVGQEVKNIIPEGFAERLLADGRRSAPEALAQQIGMGIELYGRRRDGVEFPIEIMLSPLESAEGVLVTAAIRDISVRRDAEKHLAQMEGRYRGLLEAAPDAMVVVNQDGEIVLLNIRAEQQFGYSRDELLGQQVKNIIPEGFAERLLADGRRSAPEALAQQIGMGIELYGRRRDSAEFPIEIMLSPLESTEGVLVTAAIRDISVRRDAEKHLAQMEGRYRGLLEAAPDAMVVVNQDGEIVLLNIRAEQQFGYSRDELLGQEVKNIIPEGFAERLLADGRRSAPEALAQQIGMGIELYGRRRDSAEFPIEIMLSPLKSAEGVLVTAAIRDISVRRDAEKRLAQMEEGAQLARAQAEEANRAKSRFLAAVSHELRTPLNGILGYTQLLRIEGGLNVTQSGRVNAMLGAGTHLLQMINSVLDLSEIEAGHIELQTAEFGLRDVASTCLDFVRPAAEAKALELELAMEPGVPNLVTTDPIRLRQVLLNLLGNAVKFTVTGSVKLRVGSAADRVSLRFEVVDTGPGISAEHRQSLFQEFKRLEAHSTAMTEGAGLGLAIAARLTALMGGHLGHEDSPAGGSIFWLELPVAGPVAAPPAAAELPDLLTAQPVAISTYTLHVLVVDDIAMNRDIAGSFLRAAGHQVSYAEGGTEAVAAAALVDFDAVLMDVRMPKVDGLEATRRIRSLEGSRGRVPIVALTAQAFTEQVRECRNAGMDAHVAKPFTPDTLLDAVVRAAGAKRTPSIAAVGRLQAPSRPDVQSSQVSSLVAVPVTIPAPLVTLKFGSELPVLDREAFKLTAAFLSPEAIAGYLQVIAGRGEAILRGLQGLDALMSTGPELAEAAHALAGSAGMFGFQQLATVARRFEQSIQIGAEDAPVLTKGLGVAVQLALQSVRQILADKEASAERTSA